MTYQISSLFPPFACFLFLQLSIFMIHSVASWEKTQLLNQRLNSVRLLPSQESLCDCPEHEIIAHRRQSVAQRRLSTKVWEGRVPLVFPLFAMVILSIGFALMLFARHQGTMACLGCTLKSFAGRAEEPCWSMLWFVGAVGCVSGLGALHFSSCLWDLQGDILWAYPAASGWTAEQLFGGFAWRCIRIHVTRAGLRGRGGGHWTWWRVWRVFTKRLRGFTSTFSKGFIFFRQIIITLI